MKKYKILIDCPWGIPNEILEEDSPGYLINLNINTQLEWPYKLSPSKYTKMFQEIEEVSDEEWLIQWLILNFSSISTNSHQWRPLAKTFILFGFDVNKLREQKCPASTTT